MKLGYSINRQGEDVEHIFAERILIPGEIHTFTLELCNKLIEPTITQKILVNKKGFLRIPGEKQ